ncbi:MAG TPA: glycosyltransferase family 2 protein [Mesotoga infera]|uniref:Glycosyltransferase family 2 protein n=1 Tax=Mesotoga infera TaxID=1236046 RepID=A0A7C1CV89_9BACT|nr:glycosyltransferase family 2 protein [Mesotoga infera]
MEEQELPKVTIIVPTRNEVHFIEKCLNSFLISDYPEHLMEIIIVDGMSEDGTSEIVKRYCKRDKRIVLINNQKLITPVAMNLGVKASKGEYIFFSGAHSEMPSDYISKCVQHAIESGADNVGGVVKTEPRVNSPVGRAIAEVLSHPIGVGGAKFRTGVTKPTEVDTVPFGCYKREVFDRIGFFNEKLVRNQDIEFNLRLKRAGGKIILFPDIELLYYARSTYKELWSNNYGNGFWVIVGAKYAKIPFSLRHLVPFIFILSLVLGAALSLLSVLIKTFSLLMILMYLFTVICYSMSIAMAAGKWKVFFASVLAFPILHVSYGVGSFVGLFSLIGRGEQN